MYIFSKKKLPEESKIVGVVQLKDLRKENSLSEEDIQKVYERDDDTEDILEFYGKKYLVSEKGKGFTKGYIPVQDCDGKHGDGNIFVEVKSRCIIPLWFLMSTAGQIAMTASLATAVAVSVLAYSLVATPKEGNIKMADTVEYNDEPVDISVPDSGVEQHGQEGEVQMNLYSYHVVGKGETLDLTNLSANDVYLQYVITDRSGENVFYESGLIEPGKADPWIPSNYLSVGENKVLFTVTPFTMDTNERCVSYSSDVTIVIQ